MSKESIKIKNLTVAYQATPVIWNIHAEVKKGQLTAILGPSVFLARALAQEAEIYLSFFGRRLSPLSEA